MSNETAAEDVGYEVLSRDTVREMHEKFMAGIDAKARKAVPEDSKDPEPLAEALKELLIACARKAVDIKPAELAREARGGMEAIQQHTAEVQWQVHAKSLDASTYRSPNLSNAQEAEVTEAAAHRKEDPSVLSTFGDDDRIYLRLKGGEGASVSPTRRDLDWYLEQKGYHVTDYAKGYATDEAGKQQFKIGRLLKSLSEDPSEGWRRDHYKKLLQGFIDDPTRTLGGSLFVVISRNSADIANMSTGRAWSSCMGAGGFNWHYVPRDVREGTLVAYMVSEKDPDVVSPLGRVLIKPLRGKQNKATTTSIIAQIDEVQNGETGSSPAAREALRESFARPAEPQRIYLLDKTYGIHNKYFTAAVQKFVEEKLNAGKNGTFTLVENLYQDLVPCLQSRRNGQVTMTSNYRQ